MMPVIAGIGALFAVLLAIVMWPGGEDAPRAGEGAKAGAAGEFGDGSVTASGAASGRKGGVAPRNYDEPSQNRRGGRLNPGVHLAEVGMAPAGSGVPADDAPPTFTSTAEEIAWYEGRLQRARKELEDRKKFSDRLPAVRERAANGPDPQRQLEVYEGRKKLVDANYARAQAKVIELERKLKDLRG